MKASADKNLSLCLHKVIRLFGYGLKSISCFLIQIDFPTAKQPAAGPDGGFAEAERRDDRREGMCCPRANRVKSEGNRLFQSEPGGVGSLITLSRPPHTVTAGTGQQRGREERTSPQKEIAQRAV